MEYVFAVVVIGILLGIFQNTSMSRHHLTSIMASLSIQSAELGAIREAAIDVQAAVKKAERETR